MPVDVEMEKGKAKPLTLKALMQKKGSKKAIQNVNAALKDLIAQLAEAVEPDQDWMCDPNLLGLLQWISHRPLSWAREKDFDPYVAYTYLCMVLKFWERDLILTTTSCNQ